MNVAVILALDKALSVASDYPLKTPDTGLHSAMPSKKPLAISDEVRFRLLRADDLPATNPHRLAYRFGLQDTKQQITEGRRLPDGTLAFDFTLKAKKGTNPDQPVFTGPHASGPVDDRFVYLSWFALTRGDYINRVKARLSTIDWKMVRASQQQDKVITADMTGWGPGDHRKYVSWYLE